MIRQYFKQALAMLKENPLLSLISIAGTALAIAMIMVLVIVYVIKTANYYPETNRSRMLYINWGIYTEGNKDGVAGNSFHLIKECFYPIGTAEAVTAVSSRRRYLLSTPAGENEYKAEAVFTDERFWKVFPFRFLSGTSFTEEEVQSGIRKVVINETLARNLYGTIEVTGKTLLVSYTEYTICGVVPDVSTLAEVAYAEIWMPHTTTQFPISEWTYNSLGEFSCYILAYSKSDFAKIRQEAEQNVKRYNDTLSGGEYKLNGQPDAHFAHTFREGRRSADMGRVIIRYVIVLLILLLVPAINLSSMTLSRMRKRVAEIGVRKAFGATQTNLLIQILSESLILSITGGIIGLGLSYVAIFTMKEWLLQTYLAAMSDGITSLHADMMINPVIFLYAFLFCLILNLLSAGIPAWKVSRENVINALNEIE